MQSIMSAVGPFIPASVDGHVNLKALLRAQRPSQPHSPSNSHDSKHLSDLLRRCAIGIVVVAQAATITQFTPAALANTENFTIDARPSGNSEEDEYFQTVPQGLSSADDEAKAPRLGSLLEGPKGKDVQQCARKCVPTCIRGGQGAPGLGPMSVRKEVVVFKEGYRTRQYCLSECIQVCSLQLNPPKPPAPSTQEP